MKYRSELERYSMFGACSAMGFLKELTCRHVFIMLSERLGFVKDLRGFQGLWCGVDMTAWNIGLLSLSGYLRYSTNSKTHCNKVVS